MSTPSPDADIWELRGILADQLGRFPVEDWPATVIRAVSAVLDLHPLQGEDPEARSAPVLTLVRSSNKMKERPR